MEAITTKILRILLENPDAFDASVTNWDYPTECTNTDDLNKIITEVLLNAAKKYQLNYIRSCFYTLAHAVN